MRPGLVVIIGKHSSQAMKSYNSGNRLLPRVLEVILELNLTFSEVEVSFNPAKRLHRHQYCKSL